MTTLEGEVVRDVKPIIGYVHTGIEKSCEDHQYWKVITFVERMDYLSYYFNSLAFCMAVETLLDEEVPPRAQYLRVIHLELNRIASHLFWLGTSILDLGAISPIFYALRERDRVLDLFEMSGGPADAHALLPGRRRDGGHPARLGGQGAAGSWPRCPSASTSTRRSLDQNEIFLQRTKGTGIVPRERVLELGVTGPLLRATGDPWDLRKATPYSPTTISTFKIPVGTVGDNYDRYRVRMAEMRESCKIIEQALDGLPEGPWITDNRKVALPPRHELATSHGGADPPLQARDRGLPRAAGRGLRADRVAARRAGLLRSRGRLGQAGARAHARPVVREPAARCRICARGELRSRSDRFGRDARSDPRGD